MNAMQDGALARIVPSMQKEDAETLRTLYRGLSTLDWSTVSTLLDLIVKYPALVAFPKPDVVRRVVEIKTDLGLV